MNTLSALHSNTINVDGTC